MYKPGANGPILPIARSSFAMKIAAKLQFGQLCGLRSEVGTVIAKAQTEQEG